MYVDLVVEIQVLLFVEIVVALMRRSGKDEENVEPDVVVDELANAVFVEDG